MGRPDTLAEGSLSEITCSVPDSAHDLPAWLSTCKFLRFAVQALGHVRGSVVGEPD